MIMSLFYSMEYVFVLPQTPASHFALLILLYTFISSFCWLKHFKFATSDLGQQKMAET